MNIRIFPYIVCLVIFFLFANQTRAEEWVYYSTSATRDAYYDKSSIKIVNNHVTLSTKLILNEAGKTKYFSFLKTADKAPNNPGLISDVLGTSEIDCAQGKMKELSLVIYDEKNKVLYSSPMAEIDKWYDILPNSVGEKLKKIVCEKTVAPQEVIARGPVSEKPVTPKESAAVVPGKIEKPIAPQAAVAAPSKVQKPAIPQEAVVTIPSKAEPPVNPKEVVAVAPAVVSDKKPAQVNSNQNEIKTFSEKAASQETVQNLIIKWLNSWKTGDMGVYRSCYASDFKAKRMNLDSWVKHKAKISQKSKNINISIDKLQISEEGNSATAVFMQSYGSSIFEYYTGKKKLELRKTNGEWKIFREIM